jgi:hypothetical protein
MSETVRKQLAGRRMPAACALPAVVEVCLPDDGALQTVVTSFIPTMVTCSGLATAAHLLDFAGNGG